MIPVLNTILDSVVDTVRCAIIILFCLKKIIICKYNCNYNNNKNNNNNTSLIIYIEYLVK